MTKITYQPPHHQTIVQPRPQSELAVRLTAATIIAGGILVLTFLASLLIASIVDRQFHWFHITYAFLIALTTAAVTGAGAAVWWSYQLITKPQRIADYARWRTYRIEDQDRADRARVAEQLAAETDTTDSTSERLEVIAYAILQRHAAGQPVTRSACTEAGISTQQEWASVMRAFSLLGWRKGYRLICPPDLNITWREWEARTYTDPKGRLWVSQDQGRDKPIN